MSGTGSALLRAVMRCRARDGTCVGAFVDWLLENLPGENEALRVRCDGFPVRTGSVLIDRSRWLSLGDPARIDYTYIEGHHYRGSRGGRAITRGCMTENAEHLTACIRGVLAVFRS